MPKSSNPKPKTKSGQPATKRRRRKPAPKSLSAQEIIRLLGPSYGPFEHARRIDPAEELVFTILSQHTSDINSGRAFGRLMEEFRTLEAVAAGSMERISQAISVGGLARIKAPRIKRILNLILEKRGNLDLNFLAEMPLADAKAWLR